MRAAWIGLGVMGYPMAGHLVSRGGLAVTVYNRTAAKAEKWTAAFGNGHAPTPAAAAKADVPHRPVTRRRLARDQYSLPPSFTDLLPWCEYLPDHQAFLLEDGRSVGIVLEITPVGCEARPPSFMGELHQGLLGMLSNVLEIDPSPWVVQVYVQDETDLRTTSAALRDYVRADLRDSTLTRHWLAVMEEHLSATARPGGVFDDSVVTHWRWGGKLRRTRLVIYRRFRREEQPLRDSLEQLRDQVGRQIGRAHV